MTERDSLELLINIQAKGQEILAQLARATRGVEGADKDATKAGKEFEEQTKRTGDSMTGAVLKAQLLASGILKIAGAVKEYTIGAAHYAARTEQVASVMDNLARVNGMNVQSVRMVADGIKELGISTQESRNIVNMFIGSQLDLGKSLELTRMAQNAAKVAGINSSEALQRMTYAITSGQPEMLRTLGIAINFEGAYTRAAAAMGKSSNALTEQEKLNIRLNAVLARGPLLDGSYVMSLTTAAGQMQSLQRYTDDLKNSLGNGLQPVLFDITNGMERLTKFAQENVDAFQTLTAGVSALGVAGAVFAATPFLPPVGRAALAGVAGVGTYMAVNQDPVQALVDKYQLAFEKLEGQRKIMEHQATLGLLGQTEKDNEARLKEFTDKLPKFQELLRARFIEETADLYKQRRANFKPTPEPSMMERSMGAKTLGDQRKSAGVDTWELYDLGGAKVSRADLEAVIAGQPVKFDMAGLIANNPLMNPPKPGGSDAATIKKAQQIQDRIDRLILQLRAYGMSELEKFDADIRLQMADLSREGARPGQLDILSSAVTERRRALIDKFLGPVQSQQRADSMQLLLPTAPQLYGTQANRVDIDPARTEAIIAQYRERSVRGIQQYVRFQEQMVQLTAGPGGEAAAINTITQLRLDAAQREYDITKDRVKFEEETDQIRKDRLLQIAAMQHAELERYRQAAGSIYDALVQKGMSGIGDFIKGQLHVIGRTVFQNIAVEVFRTAKDSLKLGDLIGGQVGKDGKLTGLGRVLAGTPLGVDQSKLVIEQNSNEVRLNTAALKENTAAQQATAGAGAGAGIAEAAGDALDKGGAKLAGKFQRLLGSALTIGAGAYGIASGIQQGGVRGALNTTAGIASMTSGLIGSGLFGAAAAAGPIGGILMGAAAGLSLLGGLFGQSKEKFDKEQTDALNRNRYEAPVASNRVMEISGSAVDYDFTGRLRMANERPTVIQFNVSAMDAKSFLERSGDIAEALHKELRLGHRVGLDIQQAILGT